MTRSRAPLTLGPPDDWKLAEERLFDGVIIYERLPDRERAWLSQGLRAAHPQMFEDGDWSSQYARLMTALDGLAAHARAEFWEARRDAVIGSSRIGPNEVARADEAMGWTPALLRRLRGDAMDQAGFVTIATTMRAWSLTRDFEKGRRMAARLIGAHARASLPTVRRWRKHGLIRIVEIASALDEVRRAVAGAGSRSRPAPAAAGRARGEKGTR